MKVRIGFGLGIQGLARDAAKYAAFVDGLEDLGFDSLWLSERATGPGIDPMVGLSVAAGRTTRLKLGTSVQVLPGRNPVLLAKQWATLDVLSAGRALPAFGLGVVDAAEQQAFGVERRERAAIFDEALAVVRQLWAQPTIDHDGTHFPLHDVGIGFLPVQQPLSVWLGGRAPGELRRVARVADGWLPSFTTPQQVAADRVRIEADAAAWGRGIDPEHWGALVPYVRREIPPALGALVAARAPGIAPEEIVAVGHDALRARLEAFVGVGFSKLVPVPWEAHDDWPGELEALAPAVLDLQT